jgi:uncharacterized protein (TIGR03067 family)
MVHRDIKPHNLMVTADGTVKILDFGLASLAPEAIPSSDAVAARSDLTAAGAIMGTPDFISPEQAEDARQADIRSDIYSLGATLYYLLSGRVPFADGSVMHKLKSHAQIEPESLKTLRDDVPDELVAIVSKMMAKDPDERYLTPGEVADALESFLRTEWPGIHQFKTGNRGDHRIFRLTTGQTLLIAAILGCYAVYYFTQTSNHASDLPNPRGTAEANHLAVAGSRLELSLDVAKNHIQHRGIDVAKFEAELYAAISQAAGIPNDQWKTFSRDAGIEAIEGTPLSKLLLMVDPAEDTKTDELRATPAFRLLTDNLPKPLEFHSAMAPSQASGYVSLIQPSYIVRATLDFDRKTERFKGTIWFEAPDLYAGKVNFTMYYQSLRTLASELRVDSFELPELGVKLRRDDDKWYRSQIEMLDEPTDRHDIQGTWQAIYSEDRGNIASQERLSDLRFVIDEKIVATEIDGRESISKYRLYPTSSPKALDFTEAGRTKRGIYDLVGDTLRIRIAENGQRRPMAFDSQPNSASDLFVMLKRARPTNVSAPDVSGISDYDRLQGTWGVTSQVVDGVKSHRDWEKDVIYYLVLGHKIDVVGGERGDHAKYQIDATKSPKTIDVRYEDGEVERGIYEIKEGTLTICTATLGNDKRPTAFVSTPESKSTLTTFSYLDPPVQVDSWRIQETWLVKSRIVNGVAKEATKPELFICDADRLIVLIGKEKRVWTYRFVETDGYHKKINLVDEEGNTIRGIYEFEGDTMRLCLQHPQGTERPLSFESSAEKKTTLLTLQRVPPPLSAHQQIQGTWQLISRVANDFVANYPNKSADAPKYVFTGSKLIKSDNAGNLDSSFYLDSRSNEIHLIDEEWKVTLGRYRIQGNSLRLRLSQTESFPNSMESQPDEKSTLLTFIRVPTEHNEQAAEQSNILLPMGQVRSDAQPSEAAPTSDRDRVVGQNTANSLDTTYISNDTVGLLVAHPQRILSRKSKVKEELDQWFAKVAESEGLDVRNLRQIVVQLGPPPLSSRPIENFFDEQLWTVILRFDEPVDVESYIEKHAQGYEKTEHKHEMYYRHGSRMEMWFPDNRTLILAAERRILSLIDDPEGTGPMAMRMRRADATDDLLLEIDVRQAGPLLLESLPSEAQDPEVYPVIEQTIQKLKRITLTAQQTRTRRSAHGSRQSTWKEQKNSMPRLRSCSKQPNAVGRS